MRNIPTYKNLNDLLDALCQMRIGRLSSKGGLLFPIQPVRVGEKIGFVNWETCRLECLPLFDDCDRYFTSYSDCVCVRRDVHWGVINTNLTYELHVAYPYSVANSVCNSLRKSCVGFSIDGFYDISMRFS